MILIYTIELNDLIKILRSLKFTILSGGVSKRKKLADKCSKCSWLLFCVMLFTLFFFKTAYSQPTIGIGFLVRDKNDILIQQAAQLAIEHANAQGGYQGQKFELIIRSCDGPWGRTSKETVALIYEDQVPIVVTALDGRNAHLAEQVTAKSHVVMLSTLSSDPTLSRAYVPWYFRMVPDDKQQSELLFKQIFENDEVQKTAFIAFDDYDGRMSSESFSERVIKAGYSKPVQFIDFNEGELLDELHSSQFDVIVLAGYSEIAGSVIRQKAKSKLYAFQNLTNFMPIYDPVLFKKITFANSRAFDQNQWDHFQQSFEEKFKSAPNPSMAYVYDGILLAVEAVKKYGPDSEDIRLGFKNLKFESITGKIAFGDLGNRIFENL